MPLISPNARHFVKLTRNILVDGKGKVAGDVVDVNQATKIRLIGMGVAIDHPTVLVEPSAAVEKTFGKAKGK
jgi:hypothetical protein